MMRFGRHLLQPLPQMVFLEKRIKLGFECVLTRRARVVEAQEWLVIRVTGWGGKNPQQPQSKTGVESKEVH